MAPLLLLHSSLVNISHQVEETNDLQSVDLVLVVDTRRQLQNIKSPNLNC